MLWPFRFPPSGSTKPFLPWHLSTSPSSRTAFLCQTPSSTDCTTTTGVLCEPVVPRTTSDEVFGWHRRAKLP
jgi:hypothetical protein